MTNTKFDAVVTECQRHTPELTASAIDTFIYDPHRDVDTDEFVNFLDETPIGELADWVLMSHFWEVE